MIWTFLSNLFKATGQVAEATEKRDELLNTPEMQANADAATKEQIRTAATDAVASGDTKSIENQLADQ